MGLAANVELYDHQADFVETDHLHPAIIGGYGCGKTFAVIMRILERIRLRNEQKVSNPLIAYGAPTHDLVNTIFLPDFLNMLRMMRIKFDEHKGDRMIVLKNRGLKGTVKYLTLNNPERIVGFSAADIIYDETGILPMKTQALAWKNGLARLRQCDGGTLAIATTPEGLKKEYELIEEGKLQLINASTLQNKHLPQSYIDELISNYDEQHQQMYVHGKFVNLMGSKAIYQPVEYIEPLKPDETPHEITLGIDFNVDPFCVAVSGFVKGVKITFDEFYIRNLGGADGYASYTDKAMGIVLQRYPNLYWREAKKMPMQTNCYNITARPDMTGGARKTAAGITDIQIINKHGITLDPTSQSNPYVTDRLKISNIAIAKGLWKITKNCEQLKKDVDNVVTDEFGEIIKEDKMRTHMLDAVTYDVYRDFYKLLRPKRVAHEY